MSEITAPDGSPASSLCFGATQIGGHADGIGSGEIYDACRATGINSFTAHCYAEGRSERLLGRFAAAERDPVILASRANDTGGTSAENIRQSFDGSRRRRGVDAIDLDYFHGCDAAERDVRGSFRAARR